MHMSIYIYMCMCLCIYVYVCLFVCLSSSFACIQDVSKNLDFFGNISKLSCDSANNQ